MSSALSITRAVNPPRAVYLDYPLGHTAGKPLDEDNQMSVMRATLKAFADISSAGELIQLDYEWQADHSWKDKVMRPRPQADDSPSGSSDDRVARHDTPQYQLQTDADLADAHCPTCVFPQEPK